MRIPLRVRRLTDPRSLENGLASSAALGALTLVDPARLSPVGRLAYRGATAGLAAAGVAIELAASDEELALDRVSRAALTVGGAGLFLGVAEISEEWDRRLFRYLDGRGVRRPRLLMAAGAAAFSLASFAVGRWFPPSPPGEGLDELVSRPVPGAVRDLVLGMLDTTEGFGSEALRAQLETAQVLVPADETDFSPVVEFVVADDTELAVPHTCTFPVKAQFRTDDGNEVRAVLSVQDGMLEALVLDTLPTSSALDDADGVPDLEQFRRWPAPDEVTFVLDSATR